MQLGQNAARLLDVPNTPTKILKIERGSEAYGLQIPNLVSSIYKDGKIHAPTACEMKH